MAALVRHGERHRNQAAENDLKLGTLFSFTVTVSPTFMFQLAVCRMTEVSSGTSYFIAQVVPRTFGRCRRQRRFWGATYLLSGECIDLSSACLPFRSPQSPIRSPRIMTNVSFHIHTLLWATSMHCRNGKLISLSFILPSFFSFSSCILVISSSRHLVMT